MSEGKDLEPDPNKQILEVGVMRYDLRLIADMIAPGSRVLDVGCGDGALLGHLYREKKVDGRGMELSMEGVREAVSHGLSVIQGDADTDLSDYPSGAFDYVILSQTLPATHRPRDVVEHLLRIGRWAIVSFPNFGHWSVRGSLMLRGRMPVNQFLPYEWWETPNIHFFTLRDFLYLCGALSLRVETGLILDSRGRVMNVACRSARANIFGQQAIFLLTRADES